MIVNDPRNSNGLGPLPKVNWNEYVLPPGTASGLAAFDLDSLVVVRRRGRECSREVG